MALHPPPNIHPVLPRSLYTAPPQAQSAQDDQPTLLVSWWCTGFALAIILVRIAGRYIRSERLFREDRIMALSIVPLLARMGLVHVILLWGTNNAIISPGTSQEAITRREVGSRLVLASRIMYAAFLWIAKFTISEFLKRLTSQVWRKSYEVGLQIIRYFLLLTFIAVVVATLSECQPFNHYWQVVPDPGPKCREGVAQLMTMGISDIITDLLLVVFPIPIVMRSNMPLKRKCSLVPLFGLSLILVAITIYRIVSLVDREYSQQFRSLLASLEILAAAGVSNALILGSFIRDRGTKKQRWRHAGGSTEGHSSQDQKIQTPRKNITLRHWGSDADLVGDLGIICTPELSEQTPPRPRPPPTAPPGNTSYRHAKKSHPPMNEMGDLDDDTETLAEKPPFVSVEKTSPASPTSPSFFDVGGLLESNARSSVADHNRKLSAASTGPAASSQPSSRQSVASGMRKPRAGSDVLLHDLGGLLGGPSSEPQPQPQPQRGEKEARSRRVTPLAAPPKGRPSRSPPEISDPGGLLSR